MVVYYSWSGKTKAYAEALAEKQGLRAFELREKGSRGKGKIAFFKACLDGILKRETAVATIPDISAAQEIFICTPVWAASVTPAVRYFINHADFKGKRVNLLLTCGSRESSDSYKQYASALLEGKGCVLGTACAFTTDMKRLPDSGEIKENLGSAIK